MFDFKIFFEKFFNMLKSINKKVILSSLLVVVTALFCFSLSTEEKIYNFSKNDEQLLIKDEIIPTVQSAKAYSKQKDMELRSEIAQNRVLKLYKDEEKKNLRGSSNLGQENEEEKNYALTDSEYNTLLTIVEAEATDEDLKGKILIANVVLNRVKDDGFPDSIEGVVFQKIKGRSQFSPIDDGRFYKMTISDDTRKAVELALNGNDDSQGALFFVAKSMTSSGAYSWFDNSLDFLFEHGVHSFYKYP